MTGKHVVLFRIIMFQAYLMTYTFVPSNETLQLRFGSERLNNMHLLKLD